MADTNVPNNHSSSSDDLERDVNANSDTIQELNDPNGKIQELEILIKDYEERMTAFQSDIFAKTAENRRLMARIKDLEVSTHNINYFQIVQNIGKITL